MRIKVLSGGRKNIELPLSDAELNLQMRRIGIEETVPMCRLVEVSEKDNPLHRFEGQTVNMDEVVAVVEVQNKREDTEFFYLPMDICSMNKVKERLQVQDYWEMEVIENENLRLPDILVPIPEDLREVEQLTLFNEMCHAVKRFDEVKMNQLAMVVEFTSLRDFPDVAYVNHA